MLLDFYIYLIDAELYGWLVLFFVSKAIRCKMASAANGKIIEMSHNSFGEIN